MTKIKEHWSLNRSRALERLNSRMLKRNYYHSGPIPMALGQEFHVRGDFWKAYSEAVGAEKMNDLIPIISANDEWDFNSLIQED